MGKDPTAVAVGEGVVWVASGGDGDGVAHRSHEASPDPDRGRREQSDRARRRRRLGLDRGDRPRLEPQGRHAARRDAALRRQAAGAQRLRSRCGSAHVADVQRARVLPARRRRVLRQPRRRPRHERAEAESRRPDVRLQAPQGNPVFRRRAGQAAGLPRVDGDAPASSRQGAAVVLPPDRGRAGLRRATEALRPVPGHRHRPRGRDDHAPPDRAGFRAHACAGLHVRLCRAGRASLRRRAATAGDRPVQARQLRRQARSPAGPQPAVQGLVAGRPPRRRRRPDRGPRTAGGAARRAGARGRARAVRRRHRQKDLRERPQPGGDPGAHDARCRPRVHRRVAAPGVHVAEHPGPAVRRARRPPGAQLRRRPRSGRGARRRRQPRAVHLPARSPRLPRLQAVVPLHGTSGPGRRVQRARPRTRAPPDRAIRDEGHEGDGLDLRGQAGLRRLFLVAAAATGLPQHPPRRRPDYWTYARRSSDPRNHAQIGINAWQADIAVPSNFAVPFLCEGGGPDPVGNRTRHLCDRGIDAQAAAARRATGAESNALWQKLYERIEATAAAVPLVNRREVTLVSDRVGNFQHHPMWGTLLDQLWVR